MAKASVRSKSKAAGRSTERAKQLPTKRRATPIAKPRKGAPRREPQSFTVSHARDGEFKADGLRPYARYRDLGIAAASGGLCQAHVIRMVPPATDEVRKRHYHETELQLIYVLKGWMKNEFEGHGEQLMEAGSCWLQPPKIKHTVLDYSDDLEVLEIIVPADFKTVDLTK
jgi:mannose-6-phosphate isomerase-like protein (cupin superfamily)